MSKEKIRRQMNLRIEKRGRGDEQKRKKKMRKITIVVHEDEKKAYPRREREFCAAKSFFCWLALGFRFGECQKLKILFLKKKDKRCYRIPGSKYYNFRVKNKDKNYTSCNQLYN